MINTTGRPADSFVSMDIMRIPLGILSGMGFIGAGSILRRGDLLIGVTTAGTLWFATVVGLCLGGGQLALGITATVLGVAILWCLRWAERLIPQQRRGRLTFAVDSEAAEDEVRSRITASGLRVTSQAIAYLHPAPRRKLSWEVEWRSRPDENLESRFLREIAARPEITELEWKEASGNT